MSTDNAAGPKVFLSYSWSSPEYIDRVAALAENLVGHSVEVVFDQWDLDEGQDVHAYMEQAVNDPTISHVLILCDPPYADKANDRKGGVAHCVLNVPRESIRVPNPFGLDLKCTSITPHEQADVAVLEFAEADPFFPYGPFALSSGDPPVGVQMVVHGAVVSVPRLIESPVFRIISGLSQRFFQHQDHSWTSPALELGVAIPKGMSGGPVCTLMHLSTVVGMAIGSIRSEIIESAVEEVQTDGSHYRERVSQITFYGVALHLVSLTPWLQEVIPGYPAA